MKLLKHLTLAIAGLTLAVAANAATTSYQVTDAAGNCSSGGATAGHGLWTNGDFTGGVDCGSYYSIQSGTLIVDDTGAGSATLTASATNTAGLTADINLIFTDTSGSANYKQENGGPANATTLVFSDIAGTITVDGTSVTTSFVSPYGFQLGLGANGKSPTPFGASSWLVPELQGGADHWDININLTQVPIPAAAWLFISALGGLVVAKRKQLKA